jgi:hypothetical protein
MFAVFSGSGVHRLRTILAHIALEEDVAGEEIREREIINLADLD